MTGRKTLDVQLESGLQMNTGTQDEAAARFAALVKPHFDGLFRLAYRLTGTRSDAEDLLQDVMIRLYEQPDALDTVADLKPWLSRVLYNRFVDTRRAQQRRPLSLVGDSATDLEQVQDPNGDLENASNPELLGEAAERRQRLEHAMARLSEDHRLLLLMHDAEGYTLKEIEALTEIPVGTLKSRLSRARSRLREFLWDLPENDAPARPKKMEPFFDDRRVGG